MVVIDETADLDYVAGQIASSERSDRMNEAELFTGNAVARVIG